MTQANLPLTIWMNMPSFYQGDLFRAITALPGVDLEVVFARPITADREALGWTADLEGYSSHFLNLGHSLPDAMRRAWDTRERIHVVNGIWAEPAFAAGLSVMALMGARYALYSEAPDPFQARSALKGLVRSAFGRVILWRASGFFPISHLATTFFRGLGAREGSIYPFGYFRSAPEAVAQIPPQRAKPPEVIYVGQLIHRKGVDLLVQAMIPLLQRRHDLSLTFIGTGPMLPHLQAAAKGAGLEDRVAFPGVLPASQIPERIAAAAVLVLPSRWDGWGLVVNEALSVGVPVVVSDHCGASDLVSHGRNGYVFRSEDSDDLRSGIASLLDGESGAARAAAYATGAKVSTDQAGPYLVKCLRHMVGDVEGRPTPPWSSQNQGEEPLG